MSNFYTLSTDKGISHKMLCDPNGNTKVVTKYFDGTYLITNLPLHKLARSALLPWIPCTENEYTDALSEAVNWSKKQIIDNGK